MQTQAITELEAWINARIEARFKAETAGRSNAEVEARIDHIVPNGKKPYAYEFEPPAGTPRRSAAYRDELVRIRDARARFPQPSLDRQGFTLRRHETRVDDFYDPAEIRRVYYAEVEQLVKDVTGATTVFVFDSNVRNDGPTHQSGIGVQVPVSRAHNDYTMQSALRRVRDVVPSDEARRLLDHRVVQINVWRPIRGPLQTMPLAVLDAASLQPEDLVACDLIYRDRIGEIYYLAHNPQHAWYYFPDMRREEVLLLKGFDSDKTRARFGVHAAFAHPHTAADAPPRESIEVRTFAFVPPARGN